MVEAPRLGGMMAVGRRLKVQRWGVLICVGLPLLTASVPPTWWQKGFARKRVGSVAEAELLSQLAVLLMPKKPIEEMFRSFPSPKGWGGHYLEPDLAAYGVLKDENAALFVEYDGYWRHGEKEGVERDAMKSAALLDYAPPGSYVVRIGHTASARLKDNVLWIQVGQWRAGDVQSLSGFFMDVVRQVQVGLDDVVRPEVIGHLVGEAAAMQLSERAVSFTQEAVAATGCNTSQEVSNYLISEGFSTADSDRVLSAISRLGINIEQRLQPHLRFLSSLGLSTSSAAKVVERFPQILGYGIEQNLRPKAQWLLDLGLTKVQVAKAVAGHPQILGLSIEQNLNPTVQWLSDQWLSKAQVAKVVARHPKILDCSIEQNLKPTVQWLRDLGLTKAQVAKAVTGHPPSLSYSIEQNLKPKAQWLFDLGLGHTQVASVVARYPQILSLSISTNLNVKRMVLEARFGREGTASLILQMPCLVAYRLERLTHRLRALQAQNKTRMLNHAMTLDEATFAKRFG